MIIARHLIDQMIAHAQTEAPLECCGIIATRPAVATRPTSLCHECGLPLPGPHRGTCSMSLMRGGPGHGQAQATIEAVRLYPAMNAAESEYRYEINGVEQMVIASDIEDEGLQIGGIYHSHTHAPPIPSLTDVVSAAYPDAIYVILGRFSPIQAEPVARAYRINGSAWTEEPLDIRG